MGVKSAGGYLEPAQLQAQAVPATGGLLGQKRPDGPAAAAAAGAQPGRTPLEAVLSPLGPGLRHAVLFSASEQQRAAHVLFQPAAGRCLVVVLQPSAQAARDLGAASLERTWREVWEQWSADKEQVSFNHLRRLQWAHPPRALESRR